MDWGLFFVYFLSGYLFIRLVIAPTLNWYYNQMVEIQRNALKVEEEDIKMVEEENRLLKSHVVPTDEHIEMYYKMYRKKWELDHEDQWETDAVKPMKFEDWEKRAKENVNTVGGYSFLISHTMDVFIGSCDGGSMMRYRNYREMIE